MDLTQGKVFDRVAMTWIEPEEHARRMADLEERLFQKRANQGELCAPMVITDGMAPVQSMTNGQIYDSKSAIRAEYRRAGVLEVGTEKPMKKPKPDKAAMQKARRAAIGKSLSRMGFGAP